MEGTLARLLTEPSSTGISQIRALLQYQRHQQHGTLTSVLFLLLLRQCFSNQQNDTNGELVAMLLEELASPTYDWELRNDCLEIIFTFCGLSDQMFPALVIRELVTCSINLCSDLDQWQYSFVQFLDLAVRSFSAPALAVALFTETDDICEAFTERNSSEIEDLVNVGGQPSRNIAGSLNLTLRRALDPQVISKCFKLLGQIAAKLFSFLGLKLSKLLLRHSQQKPAWKREIGSILWDLCNLFPHELVPILIGLPSSSINETTLSWDLMDLLYNQPGESADESWTTVSFVVTASRFVLKEIFVDPSAAHQMVRCILFSAGARRSLHSMMLESTDDSLSWFNHLSLADQYLIDVLGTWNDLLIEKATELSIPWNEILLEFAGLGLVLSTAVAQVCSNEEVVERIEWNRRKCSITWSDTSRQLQQHQFRLSTDLNGDRSARFLLRWIDFMKFLTNSSQQELFDEGMLLQVYQYACSAWWTVAQATDRQSRLPTLPEVVCLETWRKIGSRMMQ